MNDFHVFYNVYTSAAYNSIKLTTQIPMMNG